MLGWMRSVVHTASEPKDKIKRPDSEGSEGPRLLVIKLSILDDFR